MCCFANTELEGGRQPFSPEPLTNLLAYRRRGEVVTTQLAVLADPALEVVSLEQLGRRPTTDQQRFRAQWLASKAGP